jgi:putative ABC transport system permease protein
VAILNQTAAQRYFPNEDPIGRTLRIHDPDNANWTIVGVVGDVRNQRLDRPPRPQVYVPMDQSPAGRMFVVLRSHNHNPESLARPLRDIVQRIDAEQGLADVKTMNQVVSDSAARWTVSTALFLGFGVIAVVLALAGLYSVTAFTVTERTREIAVRLALGDTPAGILRLILHSLLNAVAAGVVIGLMLALMAGRALSSLLYVVQPTDPAAFVAAAICFLFVIALAAFLSARTATKIQPGLALKFE